MAVEIKEVRNRRELKQFVDFANKLYRGNPYYVPALVFDEMNTLRRDINPAFEHCQARYWLACRNGKIVGRIAAIINPLHAQKWNQNYIRFGWFDFEDDREVSEALMNEVEKWARETGKDAIHGPLGFTDMDREGMLVEGFDELGTLATYYNHSYYLDHIKALGFEKDVDWLQFNLSVPEKVDDSIARVAQAALKRSNLHLLNARNKKDILPYVNQIFDLIDTGYSHLYGTVPLTPRQVQAYKEQYFGFIKPEFVPIVLDQNDRVVAFAITMPSLSKALQKANGKLFPFGFIHLLRALEKNDLMDLYLVAVKPELKGRGVNAILIDALYRAFMKAGVRHAETNLDLETNTAVMAQWKFFDTRQHKRARSFIKKLN